MLKTVHPSCKKHTYHLIILVKVNTTLANPFCATPFFQLCKNMNRFFLSIFIIQQYYKLKRLSEAERTRKQVYEICVTLRYSFFPNAICLTVDYFYASSTSIRFVFQFKVKKLLQYLHSKTHLRGALSKNSRVYNKNGRKSIERGVISMCCRRLCTSV